MDVSGGCVGVGELSMMMSLLFAIGGREWWLCWSGRVVDNVVVVVRC